MGNMFDALGLVFLGIGALVRSPCLCLIAYQASPQSLFYGLLKLVVLGRPEVQVLLEYQLVHVPHLCPGFELSWNCRVYGVRYI